jgi:hypothetical protein
MAVIYTHDTDLKNGGSLVKIQGLKYEGWLRSNTHRTEWRVYATENSALLEGSRALKVFEFDPRFENFEEEVIEEWFNTGLPWSDTEPSYDTLLSSQTHDSISIVWHISDVLNVLPDLSPEQCRQVLNAVKNNHDATVGVSWDTLLDHATTLFGDRK